MRLPILRLLCSELRIPLLFTRISRYQMCFSLYAKSARCQKVCSVGGSELSMAVFGIKVFRTVIATGLDVFYLVFFKFLLEIWRRLSNKKKPFPTMQAPWCGS